MPIDVVETEVLDDVDGTDETEIDGVGLLGPSLQAVSMQASSAGTRRRHRRVRQRLFRLVIMWSPTTPPAQRVARA